MITFLIIVLFLILILSASIGLSESSRNVAAPASFIFLVDCAMLFLTIYFLR